MKQFFAYDACSSEVIGRAGSLGGLLKKLHDPNDKHSLLYRLGLTKVEPWCFYVKSVHDDDDNANSIDLKEVQAEAVRIGILVDK